MEKSTEFNKKIIYRFNKEVIEAGNTESFIELIDENFVNHSAPDGSDRGPKGMLNTFNNILRPAFKDLRVTIHQQIAEGDLVTTRKTISGTHTGVLMGIPPTGVQISIDVIDIVRIDKGKYKEHWGLNTLAAVLTKVNDQKS